MNDASDNRGTMNIGSALVGVALGAVIGAGFALLMAPDSGKRTRERLASTARRLGESAGHTIEQARDTVYELGADARTAIKAGQDAFLHDRATRESRSERHMAHSGNSTAGHKVMNRSSGEVAR